MMRSFSQVECNQFAAMISKWKDGGDIRSQAEYNLCVRLLAILAEPPKPKVRQFKKGDLMYYKAHLADPTRRYVSRYTVEGLTARGNLIVDGMSYGPELWVHVDDADPALTNGRV